MKSKILKYLFLLTCFFLVNFSLRAQNDLEVTQVRSSKLVELLNNVEFIHRGRTEHYIIRLYKLHNGAGSAGFRNGEVSHNLYVAISEFDEAPDQNLFEIGPFLNPTFLKWEEAKDQGVFHLEYGPASQRMTIKITVDIENLTFIIGDK
ncbi:MAG: hypothetical protein Roseis2KO_29760 [Roseivirga sp.]